MASKQSVQFLANQLMNVGGQLRASAQQDKANALQQRYLALSEAKQKEEVIRMRKQQIWDKFAAAVQLMGGTKEAAAKIAENMSPADRAILGPTWNALEQLTLPEGYTKDEEGAYFGLPQKGSIPLGPKKRKPTPSMLLENTDPTGMGYIP